ncbi:Threonine/homoserine/homoserine lactone efflux protein [Jannaschia seohaensis]|uniref:Threonine/homoserine/homoserine lactone efflux protein n=2 Tax=Jannaschia seohaensis TaxID=475081 RepID=A0A2Y9A9N0_9RHOB|nr:threonine/homoserine/homoserine lactone efflux protein [Jannaschia seohaensis]SSA41221.1 Threonine/homoserine/homoserine lactone efflux protein [Jannaschia seohaensis]
MLAGLALSSTPGPSMLYVLSRSVGQSRVAGLASAVGLALGGVALAIATALGLAALFAAVDWIVPTLRVAGTVYLVWLGVGLIREAHATADSDLVAQPMSAASPGRILWQGIWVEVLNPKTVLFFALFLPPFVQPEAGPAWLQLLVLGALVPLTAVPSDLVVAWMGGSTAAWLRRSHRARLALGWMGGLALLAIAANLHFGLI